MQNLEAEKAILWSLLNGDTRGYVLTPEHFTNQKNRLIFTAAKELHEQSDTVDLVTVSEKLRGESRFTGGFDYLTNLSMYLGVTMPLVPKYIEMLKDNLRRRKALKLCDEIKSKIASGDEYVSLIESLLDEEAKEISIEPVGEYAHTALIRMFETKQKVIKTGIPSLDAEVNFDDGVLITLGGRPSVGKSIFAINLARNVLNAGKKVLYFSYEMSLDKVVLRMIYDVASVSKKQLLRGDMYAVAEAQKAATKISKQAFYIDELSDTLTAIKTKVEKSGGADLVIVDYLQLMGGDSAERRSDIDKITRGLKRMAMRSDIPVLALSSLVKIKDDDREPILDDFKESGNIGYDSDIVLALHRPDKDKPFVDLLVLKNKDGRARFKIPLYLFEEFGRFNELDDNGGKK